MLEKSILGVYSKFKMNFYCKIFKRFETREASLTAVETFCAEVIHALGSPTINQFAGFVGVSQPNATHKVQSLIRKGYISRTQSPADGREFLLQVTDKFHHYYDISNQYISVVAGRIQERFAPEEVARLVEMLQIISGELMPEVNIEVK